MTTNFDFLINKLKYNKDHLLMISYLLLKYNLRVSEILDVKKNDLKYPHFIIFRARKKSSNIIIRDNFVVNYFYQMLPYTKKEFFYFINYNNIYHYFRKNFSHLFKDFKSSKNNKITHGPRYYYAHLTNEPELVRDILNHRSLRSGKYYNKQLKEN